MLARHRVFTFLMGLCAASAAQAAEPFAYDFGGRMGFYHQSWIIEKTPLDKKDTYRVRTKRVDNTGGIERQEDKVDCNPQNPSASGKWGKYEGKVFDKDYEVSGATQSVYNLLWAVCRGEVFKSLGTSQLYQGYHEVPVAEDEVKGETYKVHIRAQDAMDPFWAVRKVTLEYRRGSVRGRKTAHVFCDYDVPTVTVDGKTHELAGTLFVEKPDGERNTGTWERVWIATCIGRSLFEPKNQ